MFKKRNTNFIDPNVPLVIKLMILATCVYLFILLYWKGVPMFRFYFRHAAAINLIVSVSVLVYILVW